jgi:hypothetical protein
MPDPKENLDEEQVDNEQGEELQDAEDDGEGEQDGQGAEHGSAEEPPAQGEGSEEQARQAQPVSRAEKRINALREETRRATETAAQARRELEEFRAAEHRRQQLPDPRLEAERIAAMSPDERAQHYIAQERQRSEQQFGQLRFEMADSADKTRFDALKAGSPIAARLAPKVEEYLANARRNGQNFNRDVILKYLAGEEALARTGKEKAKQAQAGAARIAQQRTRPLNGASDVSASRRNRDDNSPEAIRARLEGRVF